MNSLQDMEECTLDSMSTGDVVFTVPWAMLVDSNGRCWLHPKYTAHTQPVGTVQMRVKLQEDGYHVWRVDGYRYSPIHSLGFASPADNKYLPVVELHGNELR